MAPRRTTAPFRPLSSRPRPQTIAAQRERRLRELEAEETAQDALRFARDIRRRQVLEDASAVLDDDPPHQPAPELVEPEEAWEDIPGPPDALADPDPQDFNGEPDAQDPILLSLHEQAKQIKRKKLLDHWDAQYAQLFDAYLEGKDSTSDWSTPQWSQDRQPPCNCSPGVVRERAVVLVDIHGTSDSNQPSSLVAEL